MIKLRKKHYISTIYRLFLMSMAAIIMLFTVRVHTRSEVTPMPVGQALLTAKEYTWGTIYDRNSKAIVSGKEHELIWASNETKNAFQQVLGVDVESTLLSEMTIVGNCRWLLGVEDNRLEFADFLSPFEERQGGSVKLTLDKDLQEYVAELIGQYGVKNSYAIVSDYSTGEILAVYGDVFGKSMHPGSTLKPILAAAVMSLYPELETYTYNCLPSNHEFQTKSGSIRINCAGNVFHGSLQMGDAMACSCNGYFIRLLQQCVKEELLEKLKLWGFDTTVSYDQLMYWDHTFIENSSSETNYMMAAIGQANARITPAGLHFCTNTLLNHGQLEEPVWYTQKQRSPDEPWEEVSDKKSKSVCDTEIADKVVDMMKLVTERGTGQAFYLPDFAAKTGTAQTENEKGELTNLYTIWTTGGLANEKTPYSVTVCLDKVTEAEGGSNAGQIAKEILAYMKGDKNDEEK